MAPILLYYAFKATTPFVDAFVNETLRQLLPSINDCLLASSPCIWTELLKKSRWPRFGPPCRQGPKIKRRAPFGGGELGPI